MTNRIKEPHIILEFMGANYFVTTTERIVRKGFR